MIKEQEPKPENSPQLPTLTINLKNRIVSVDGRFTEIKGDFAWQTLLLLALNPNQDSGKSEIKKAIRTALPQSDTPKKDVSFIIYRLRNLIKIGNHCPSIIINTQQGRGNLAKYRLNANVEIITENMEGVNFEKKKIKEKDLGPSEEKAIHALFDLKENGSGFRCVSLEDVMLDVYGNKFLFMSNPEEKEKKRLEHLNEIFPKLQKGVIAKLSEVCGTPLDKIDRPRLTKAVRWLKEQAIYEKLTLNELILIAERRMSYEELIRARMGV